MNHPQINIGNSIARIISGFSLLLLMITGSFKSVAQPAPDDRIVQITGVIMTADSLRAIPGTTVLVKNQNRGVYASDRGVFTIVCYKGDTLQFSATGFRGKDYVVPLILTGQYFSMVQLMVQDTFYLPESIVRPLPSKEAFGYAFVHWHIPDDKYEIARKNTDQLTLRAIAYTMPHDGRESQSMYQHQAAADAVYYGQQRPNNILNPLAWAEFFDAWKRGDFRKKY